MDGFLVIISLVDILISLTADSSPRIFGILRVFRLLRTLRPLRWIVRSFCSVRHPGVYSAVDFCLLFQPGWKRKTTSGCCWSSVPARWWYLWNGHELCSQLQMIGSFETLLEMTFELSRHVKHTLTHTHTYAPPPPPHPPNTPKHTHKRTHIHNDNKMHAHIRTHTHTHTHTHIHTNEKKNSLFVDSFFAYFELHNNRKEFYSLCFNHLILFCEKTGLSEDCSRILIILWLWYTTLGLPILLAFHTCSVFVTTRYSWHKLLLC